MILSVSAQQRANALEALNVMWPSVPPKNVHPGLRWWNGERYEVCGKRVDKTNQAPNCGTVACFGGWCAWWPNFRKQGVKSSPTGAPMVYSEHTDGFTNIADRFLFGHDYLFAPRGSMDCDMGFMGNDHKLVSNRLRWLIKNTKVAA